MRRLFIAVHRRTGSLSLRSLGLFHSPMMEGVASILFVHAPPIIGTFCVRIEGAPSP